METTKVGHKYNELFVYFGKHFQWHQARIKFFVLLITPLCKMQTVCFEPLAEGMDSNAQISSCLRRIQRFFAQFTIDNDKVASVLFSLLPCKTSLVISIDRTNWQFIFNSAFVVLCDLTREIKLLFENYFFATRICIKLQFAKTSFG